MIFCAGLGKGPGLVSEVCCYLLWWGVTSSPLLPGFKWKLSISPRWLDGFSHVDLPQVNRAIFGQCDIFLLPRPSGLFKGPN